MTRPSWFPRRLFAFLTGKDECADCHRWFTIWRMHPENPDVCVDCGLDRLIRGIEDAARWSLWCGALAAATSYAETTYQQRAHLARIRAEQEASARYSEWLKALAERKAP